MALTKDGAAALLHIVFEGLDDEELVAAYQLTDRKPGSPLADLLVAEMQRREIA